MHSLPFRLLRRFFYYTIAGTSTFALDLLLLTLLTSFTSIPRPIAIGACFFDAVSLNFLLCYHWVYRGTPQEEKRGYVYFLSFALVGVAVIITLTESIIVLFDVPLLMARIAVGVLVGIINFLLNTFFNFKLI